MKKAVFYYFLLFFFSSCSWATNDWHVSVAPFLWGINMHGKAQVGYRQSPVNLTNVGGMLFLNVDKARFGFFANLIYLFQSQQRHYGLIAVNATNKFGVLTGAISYQLYQRNFPYSRQFEIRPYAGFRYTFKNTTIVVNAPGFNIKYPNNVDWLDPIIGLRLRYYFNAHWFALFYGDVGGTNITRDYSVSALTLLGFHPPIFGQHLILYGGYQVLDQHYAKGSGSHYFNWDMTLSGPLVGFSLMTF